MIHTDPVHDIERSIAAQIAELVHRIAHCRPHDVHVHFRDDTIVTLLDGPGLPHLDPVDRRAMDIGIDELLGRTLQRSAASPIIRHRLLEDSLLIIVRLI